MKPKPVLIVLFLLACNGLFAQNVSLDQAVRNSSQAIEARLPRGAKIAILSFTSAAQAFSDYIIDELATALSAGRNIQVIDRQHTDAIRSEFKIQFSGDVSDDEVRRVGQQLGAQYVVTGSLVDIGNAYRFRVAAINIETAVREGSSSLNININDPSVVFLLTGQRSAQTGNTPVQTGSALSNSGTIYQIGDTGPAGGIVFYDRGFVADGWRYMEAAPSDFTAEWGTQGQDVTGTDTSIGSGKRNTQIIVGHLNRIGESNHAAQICMVMDVNGYKDWFLPSRDELDLMYKNLKQIGLGGFDSGGYWSSSQYNTEFSSDNAWYQSFNYGFQRINFKNTTFTVRAIRAF